MISILSGKLINSTYSDISLEITMKNWKSRARRDKQVIEHAKKAYLDTWQS